MAAITHKVEVVTIVYVYFIARGRLEGVARADDPDLERVVVPDTPHECGDGVGDVGDTTQDFDQGPAPGAACGGRNDIGQLDMFAVHLAEELLAVRAAGPRLGHWFDVRVRHSNGDGVERGTVILAVSELGSWGAPVGFGVQRRRFGSRFYLTGYRSSSASPTTRTVKDTSKGMKVQPMAAWRFKLKNQDDDTGQQPPVYTGGFRRSLCHRDQI